ARGRMIDVGHTVEQGMVTYKGLESLANLDCVVARVPTGHAGAIDRLGLTEADVRGRAVLVHTGLVGIDSLNIDGIATRERPEHSTLLGHDVPVVEHLRGLEALPARRRRF